MTDPIRRSTFNLKPEGRSAARHEKEYDTKIELLNERIKKAEQQKKMLNINFNPFSKTPRKDNKSTINE